MRSLASQAAEQSKHGVRTRRLERLRVCALCHVWLFKVPWTLVCQVSLCVGFSRLEYWRGLPFPPSGDLPNPGIKLRSPVSAALAGEFFTTPPPGKQRLQVAVNSEKASPERLSTHFSVHLSPAIPWGTDHFSNLHRACTCVYLTEPKMEILLKPSE